MLEGLTVDNSPLKGRHRTHGFQRRTPDTTEERIEGHHGPRRAFSVTDTFFRGTKMAMKPGGGDNMSEHVIRVAGNKASPPPRARWCFFSSSTSVSQIKPSGTGRKIPATINRPRDLTLNRKPTALCRSTVHSTEWIRGQNGNGQESCVAD